MKLKDGRIIILFDHNGMNIKLYDLTSHCYLAEVKLNQKQTCQALSRLGYTECEIEIPDSFDHINKKMICKKLKFEVPNTDKSTVKRLSIQNCPEGWKPDLYFGSQDSFIHEDKKIYATDIIRKWIPIEESEMENDKKM